MKDTLLGYLRDHEEDKTPKIYESPDKGKTVYERVRGAPHETRKMIMKDGVRIDER